MAAPWARFVIAVIASALLVAACGGEKQQFSTSSDARARAATPTPMPLVGGGGASNPRPRPPSAVREAAARFHRAVKERCKSVGEAVRVSAFATSADARKEQMTTEIAYLKALDEALDPVAKRPPERGTRELQRLLAQYLDRLRAQRTLDRRIAAADDGYSVRVGIDQNEENRDARNAIVAQAGFDGCLHAPRPR